MASEGCVDPGAPWEYCAWCGEAVKTCERKEPVNDSYVCPAHLNGIQLSTGLWVCSAGCWDLLAEDDDVER